MSDPVDALEELLAQEERLAFDGFDKARGVALGLHLMKTMVHRQGRS